MKPKPLVLYHANCWDGFCAAWIARVALGEIEAVPVHYGTKPPDVAGRDVYILDFCYKRPVMLEILSRAHFVTVLDHHQTAQAELDGIVDEFVQRPDLIASDLVANPSGYELPCVRFDMEKSGGRLAWEHFNPPTLQMNGLMAGQTVVPFAPWLVDYTEDRDLWRHRLPDSQAVNAALRSYPLDFAAWDGFAERHPLDFAVEGYAIRRRERQIVDDHVRHAREDDRFGHPVRIVNATVMFSEIAGELAKGRPFGACYFDRADGKRQWSLRSDENGIDVAALAKTMGGGGHLHAAGFEEDLP